MGEEERKEDRLCDEAGEGVLCNARLNMEVVSHEQRQSPVLFAAKVLSV